MEASLQHSLHKIEIHWLKIIPIVLSFNMFTSTILSYLDVDTAVVAYINAVIVWLFLYLSSFVFRFCRWHRMFLYYILVEGIINWYDYTYIIPLTFKPMLVIQISIAGIFLFIALYFHQHDKLPCKEDCGRPTDKLRK